MYSEWASLSAIIAENSSGEPKSVLDKFSGPAGREVAIAVVKQLAGNLGISQPAEPSALDSDQEVNWCMDVICYGLSLPLSDHDTIKDCVNVYCEWLSALHPVPRISVPKPICEDPNLYARKIINHFHNLFVPRTGEVWAFLYQDELGGDTINRQAVLCHRVLRTLQNAVQSSHAITRETWESLLLFLLAINDVLLAPPTVKDDVGDQLCERVLSVLFEVWLLACVRCYPSPSLWKTLQESCLMWRHRIALIEQWNRVNLALTSKLLDFMYGSDFPELKINEEDALLIPTGMTNDCIAQTWYRFLRTIGNPVALCNSHLISRTPYFMQFVLTLPEPMEPHLHPCLLILPQIFLKAIKGIASQVNAFLGILQYTTNKSRATGGQPLAKSNTGGSGGQGAGTNAAAGSTGVNPSVQSDTAITISTTSSSSSTSSTNRLSGVDFRMLGHGSGPMAVMMIGSNNNGGAISSSSGIHGNNHHLFHSMSLAGGSGADSGTVTAGSTATPPLQRRLAKSFSVAPSSASLQKGITKGNLIGLTSSRSASTTATPSPVIVTSQSSATIFAATSLSHETRVPLAAVRPKCNSILHLFGEWLFEAANIGTDTWIQNNKKQASEASRRPSSMIMDSRKGSISLSQPTSLNDALEAPPGLTIDRYESGRAEAIGALCRIFCAKKTGEEISPVYLARFYTAIHQGLKLSGSKECEETMISILYNSADLFRIDLDGVQVLLPAFISALELVLSEKDLKMRSPIVVVNKVELRRASINILLSILTLPLHFQNLIIRDLNATGGTPEKNMTFIQLKPKMINILMNAIQVEVDAENTHMLLGGLMLCVQDSVTYEGGSESGADMTMTSESNLLSSACSEKSACSINSANSSLGGNSSTTTTFGNDFSSLTLSDDFPADIFNDIDFAALTDCAHALFVRATYLVCHRLISSWKTDLNVSLAALELLSGLARMSIKDSDALECKRAVKWVCDYIYYQCTRPTPAHTKDLHSTIVAAFQCISAWLMQHPYLLQDKECLMIVLEVVELGISGTKSVGKPGEPAKLKDEKELKPVSMRVRDAAECLLAIILEQVGYFPSECGAQSLSSLLDEVSLVKYCNSMPDNPTPITYDGAVQKFRYFVTENSTILALLEEPLGNDQDPQPTITLIIRGPFGRHSWTMQLRHLPRSKSGAKYHALNPGRPISMNDMPVKQEVEQKYFPDGVDRIPSCVADYSIPTLENVTQTIGTESTKMLFKLLENQTVYEKIAWAETDNSYESLSHAQEAIPPPVCHEFQAARLFLSHFGFLSFGENPSPKMELAHGPILTVLDGKRAGFSQDIQLLDRISPRTFDTVYLFYVKNGQNTDAEIIENMAPENVQGLDNHFWTMIMSLGCEVNVEEHAGWTGFYNSSWCTNNVDVEGEFRKSGSQKDNLVYNGEKKVLYWADVNAEIAFVVPNKWNKSEWVENTTDGSCLSLTSNKSIEVVGGNYERSMSDNPSKVSLNLSQKEVSKKPALGQNPRTMSLDSDKGQRPVEPVPPSRRRTGANKPSTFSQSTSKILLVWLESYEDHLSFPLDDLLSYTSSGSDDLASNASSTNLRSSSDSNVIFLQSLSSGLLRVKLQGPISGRMNNATPLVDGMVINKRVVGNLVRQTAYNMAKRRRLDNDSHQPPHVKRRLKVQEIVNKYKLDMTEPELLAHLFNASTSTPNSSSSTP